GAVAPVAVLAARTRLVVAGAVTGRGAVTEHDHGGGDLGRRHDRGREQGERHGSTRSEQGQGARSPHERGRYCPRRRPTRAFTDFGDQRPRTAQRGVTQGEYAGASGVPARKLRGVSGGFPSRCRAIAPTLDPSGETRRDVEGARTWHRP